MTGKPPGQQLNHLYQGCLSHMQPRELGQLLSKAKVNTAFLLLKGIQNSYIECETHLHEKEKSYKKVSVKEAAM